MKSIKMLLLAVAITFSGVLSASTAPTDAETNTITTDIAKRLEHPNFLLEKEVLTNVMLTINKDNELVVLSVDSDNKNIIGYIKNRLNYSKVSVELYGKLKNFTVPVRLTIED